MRDDKVEVIIPQERYNELLETEQKLREYERKNSIFIGYKYLDTRHYMNSLDKENDTLHLYKEVGEEVPELIKDFVTRKTVEITDRIDSVNDYRNEKISEAIEKVREEIEWKMTQGYKPSSIKRWFNSFFGITHDLS